MLATVVTMTVERITTIATSVPKESPSLQAPLLFGAKRLQQWVYVFKLIRTDAFRSSNRFGSQPIPLNFFQSDVHHVASCDICTPRSWSQNSARQNLHKNRSLATPAGVYLPGIIHQGSPRSLQHRFLPKNPIFGTGPHQNLLLRRPPRLRHPPHHPHHAHPRRPPHPPHHPHLPRTNQSSRVGSNSRCRYRD